MLLKINLLIVFLFSVLTTFAQTDTGEKTHTKLIKVSNNIYMLQGKGGNIGLSFGNDGVFMIDDQYAEGWEQIQEDIKRVSDKPIKFLVNTHFHGDHTGANSALAKTGTVIFSQDNVRDRLKKVMNKESKKQTEDMLPVVTFNEDLTFHFNGEKIYVFHVHNAHTDGDAMVYFTGSNVLHTGDVFFNGKYPYIDVENGGDVIGYIDALEKAVSLINEDTKIIPGHGDIGNVKDLKSTINMLTTLYKRVTSAYISNKTEEEVLAMTEITQEFDAQGYGSGFIKTEDIVKLIYKQAAKGRSDIDQLEIKNKEARKKVEQMQKEWDEKEKAKNKGKN